MRGIRALWLMLMLLTADGVSAQLVEKVLRAIEGDSLAPVTTIKADSDSAVSLSAIKQELEAARLNEANLRMEMEQLRLASYAADSVKHLQQKQRIDSLRKVTPGVPVVVEGDTLFYLYAKRGGHTPQQRAEMDAAAILELICVPIHCIWKAAISLPTLCMTIKSSLPLSTRTDCGRTVPVTGWLPTTVKLLSIS